LDVGYLKRKENTINFEAKTITNVTNTRMLNVRLV